jgi:hypothetical protein
LRRFEICDWFDCRLVVSEVFGLSIAFILEVFVWGVVVQSEIGDYVWFGEELQV